jgi:hypothetical protein
LYCNHRQKLLTAHYFFGVNFIKLVAGAGFEPTTFGL